VTRPIGHVSGQNNKCPLMKEKHHEQS